MRSKSDLFIRLFVPLAIVCLGSACNLQLAAQTSGGSQAVGNTATGTIKASASPSPSSTLKTAQAQTASLTLTPSVTATPTMKGVTMTAGQNLSCVTGPKWDLYDWVAEIKEGDIVTLLARSTPEWGEYYYVRMGNGTECWAYGGSSTINGDPSSLPIKEAPPTPTPKTVVDYSVSYISTERCPPVYFFRFQVNNTGTETLESIRIVVTDNTTASTFTHVLDNFRGMNGCGVDSNKPSLSPGEGGAVSNGGPGELGYDPTGHSITATFTICTENCLLGTCVNRTIHFTA